MDRTFCYWPTVAFSVYIIHLFSLFSWCKRCLLVRLLHDVLFVIMLNDILYLYSFFFFYPVISVIISILLHAAIMNSFMVIGHCFVVYLQLCIHFFFIYLLFSK